MALTQKGLDHDASFFNVSATLVLVSLCLTLVCFQTFPCFWFFLFFGGGCFLKWTKREERKKTFKARVVLNKETKKRHLGQASIVSFFFSEADES